MKFHGQSSSGGTKRVASEEIIEIEDLAKRSRDDDGDVTSRGGSNDVPAKSQPTDESIRKPAEMLTKFAKPMNISVGAMSNGRNALKNLVKRKTVEKAETAPSTPANSSSTSVSIASNSGTSATNSKPLASGLSLLAGYDDSSGGSDDSD